MIDNRGSLNAVEAAFNYPGGHEVIKGLNVALKPSEITLLVGPNGSGKTTLIKLLTGLLQPSAGCIQYSGRTVRAGCGAGLVLQAAEDLLFGATVEEEITLGLREKGLLSEETTHVVKDVCGELGIPESWLNRSPFALSGGEKRRVAMAAVIALRPAYLFLDEPTVGLDYSGVVALLAVIEKLRSRGTSVIIATHNWEPFLPLADRVLALDEGRLAFDGDGRRALREGIIHTSWNELVHTSADFLTPEEAGEALRVMKEAGHGTGS